MKYEQEFPFFPCLKPLTPMENHIKAPENTKDTPHIWIKGSFALFYESDNYMK